MKIISVVGARPQLIKEAMFQDELRKHNDIKHIFVHTGQHYDFEMSDVFIQQLDIKKPDYFLGINRHSNVSLIGFMIIELEKVFLQEKPDYVVVYGDTDSTLAAALTSKKLNISVVHIEAGLRQSPKTMPEEVNRVLTDHMSKVLFTSSEVGIRNLNLEGIHEHIYNVGDIMYDVFLKYLDKFNAGILNQFNLEKEKFILFTLHRNFNVDNKLILTNILTEMSKVAREIKIIFPIHPRTRKMIQEFQIESLIKDMILTSPLDYISLISVAKYSLKIVTDSGGLQKEAYFLRKNALIIMEDTSWIELIEKGYNKLIDKSSHFNEDVLKFSSDITIDDIYGAGSAAKKIINYLKRMDKNR